MHIAENDGIAPDVGDAAAAAEEEKPMKKFVNHIDHVTWIARPENLEAYVDTLEKLTGAKLERLEREDHGMIIYLSWEAGLEVVAPMAKRTDFNSALHDHLAAHGEGLYAVVFGVGNLEKHERRLEELGFQLGPRTSDTPDSPFRHKRVLRERIVGPFMNGLFVLGDIDYPENVVRFEDTDTQDTSSGATR